MQSSTEVKNSSFERTIKSGKYDFVIQGILTKDKNGYDLKTKNGKSYKKIRIILLGLDGSNSVYKAVFSKEDIRDVVLGLGNTALTHVYNSDPDGFDLETLIGEEGRLLLGYKNNYPNIECFLKKTLVSDSVNETGVNFKKELDAADNVPF